MATLREYVSDFEGIGVEVVEGNIEVSDRSVPWRAVEIAVYGSTDEFYDCVYEDVCNYFSWAEMVF